MRARFVLALLIAYAHCARAEVEVVEQWEQWLHEPLLLSEAEADELAILPWLDRGLAEAIVGLRSAGGLQRWEDLSRVPGMDAERIAAIAPFVRLDAPSAPSRLRWESVGAFRDAQLSSVRSRIDATTGRWWLGLQGHETRERRARGAVSWSDGAIRILVGRIVVRGAWPLMVGDPGLRARTGPPPLSRVSRLAPRLSGTLPAWWGAGVEWRLGAWRMLAAGGRLDEVLSSQVHLEVERRFGGRFSPRIGMAWRWGGAMGIWLAASDESMRGRVELVRPDLRFGPSTRLERALRGSASLEWRMAAARLGLAVTQSQSGAEGQDPFTAQVLDREHRSWQLHGGLRRGGWSLSGLARELRRGHPGSRNHQQRWQAEASGPWSRSRLRLRFRLDEEDGQTRQWSAAVDWREAAAGDVWRRGLSLRRVLSRTSESLLIALHLERGVRWFLRTSIAAARGSASSLWAVGLPTVGLSSAWLAPEEWGLLLALGHRAPTLNACLWMRFEAAEEMRTSWVGGAGLRVGWGGGR